MFKAVVMCRERVASSNAPSSAIVSIWSNSSTPDKFTKSCETAGIPETAVNARPEIRTAGKATFRISWLSIVARLLALLSITSRASKDASIFPNSTAINSMNSTRFFVLASFRIDRRARNADKQNAATDTKRAKTDRLFPLLRSGKFSQDLRFFVS